MNLYSMVVPLLLGLGWLAVQNGALQGSPPTDLGVTQGRLKPPSLTRNSVSSQTRLYPQHPQNPQAHIDPLALNPSNLPAAMAALLAALRSTPGITVVEEKDDYVYAQAQTRWLGFVDDLEFWFNPQAGVIEMRSASRLGREDFGTNRERLEAVRRAYTAILQGSR